MKFVFYHNSLLLVFVFTLVISCSIKIVPLHFDLYHEKFMKIVLQKKKKKDSFYYSQRILKCMYNEIVLICIFF